MKTAHPLFLSLAIAASACGVLAASAPVSSASPASDTHGHGDGHDHEAEHARPAKATEVDAHGSEDGHSHGSEAVHPAKGGDAHGAGDGHGHNEKGEGIVELAPEALAMAGIKVVTAERGRISHVISLTGTVAANEDRTVHLNPKVEGLVREVHKTLGDRVTPGEPLVVLDSTQLGTAKVEFLKALQGMQLANLDLERKKSVAQNVATLVALLEKGLAPLDIAARTKKLQMGEHRGKLLLAYSTVRLARASNDREQRLFARKVTSEKEMLDARKDYEIAQAQYRSAVDEASYATFLEHVAAEKDARTKETAHEADLQHLKILGTPAEDIEELRNRKAKDLNMFVVRAPIEGVLTEKHVTLGERVTPETSLFVLSDLSTMWVLADVYEKDLAHVHVGMPAVIDVTAYPGRTFDGKVSIVTPSVDSKTRTVRLRIAVDNADRQLSAGMFAKVQTTTGHEESVLSIPVSAIQEVEGKPTVFVQKAPGKFQARPVTVGARDEKQGRVEVFSGIKEGESVVATGAFYLRSEMAKGEMGHDHAH